MAKKSLSSPNKIDELPYEKSLSELESIVSALESETHTLEESLTLYERGQLLAKHCAALLDQAELKVKQLSDDKLNTFIDED
ncbi:MAG: exodeoxyribonuclease VII small subunit [Anaerolineales bacterium]|nr:exodeoxyribonuclease VII small subunit [Anaerolineales bacterium]